MRAPPACVNLAAVVLLALTAPGLRAQHLDVSGGGSVTVGDPVTLAFRAVLPRGAVPLDAVLHPHDTLPSSVRLIEVDTLRPQPGADTVLAARVRVAFFLTGSQSTPAFALRYRLAGTEVADSVVSGAVLITVMATLPDTAVAMRDIRAVEPLGGAHAISPWWYVAAALIVAAFMALVIKTRRRPQPAVVAAIVRATPYETALAAIDRAAHTAPDDVEHVYETVSAALRAYIDARLGVPAVHRTTWELVGVLPAPFTEDGGGDARALLNEADLVKFARLRPDARRGVAYAARARTLVERWESRARELDATEVAGAIR